MGAAAQLGKPSVSVWGLFVAKDKYTPAGSGKAQAPIVLDSAMRWPIHNGKIVETQAVFDTAGLLVQQGQL